jgi:Zn-dependent protease with chaperone function
MLLKISLASSFASVTFILRWFFGFAVFLPTIWFLCWIWYLVLQSSCLYYLHFFQWKLNSFYALVSIVADRIREFFCRNTC